MTKKERKRLQDGLTHIYEKWMVDLSYLKSMVVLDTAMTEAHKKRSRKEIL